MLSAAGAALNAPIVMTHSLSAQALLPPKQAPINEMMDEESESGTVRCRSVLVPEFVQGKTPLAAASRQFNLTSAEIKSSVDDGRTGTSKCRCCV